jgi:hypothetical protein
VGICIRPFQEWAHQSTSSVHHPAYPVYPALSSFPLPRRQARGSATKAIPSQSLISIFSPSLSPGLHVHSPPPLTKHRSSKQEITQERGAVDPTSTRKQGRGTKEARGVGSTKPFDDNFKGGSESGSPGSKHRKFARKSGQDAQRCRARQAPFQK